MDERNARVLSLCPLPEVAAVVLHSLDLGELPTSLDERYVHRVRTAYLGDRMAWRSAKWYVNCWHRQRVIDHLVEYGPQTAAEISEAMRSFGFHDQQVLQITQDRGNAVPWPPPVAPTAAYSGNPRQPRKFRLRECPHCNGMASIAVRVPELKFGVLCPDCMRTPEADSPVYPDAYRRLRAGPD